MSSLLLPPRTKVPRAKVTLTFENGVVIRQGDLEARAELFDKLLGSLETRHLLQLSQAIGELTLSRAAEEKAREIRPGLESQAHAAPFPQ